MGERRIKVGFFDGDYEPVCLEDAVERMWAAAESVLPHLLDGDVDGEAVVSGVA